MKHRDIEAKVSLATACLYISKNIGQLRTARVNR